MKFVFELIGWVKKYQDDFPEIMLNSDCGK